MSKIETKIKKTFGFMISGYVVSAFSFILLQMGAEYGGIIGVAIIAIVTIIGLANIGGLINIWKE